MASIVWLRIASKAINRQKLWISKKHFSSFGRNYSAVSFGQTLASIPETSQTELSNGIRVATENTGTSTATVGLWIEAGTRYETPDTNGVANFVEHAILAADQRLEAAVDGLGASVHSYTDKELTAFYVKCLSSDISRAIQLLSDLVLNPKIDENIIEIQRKEILREMRELDQNYEHVVMNHLHSVAFQETPLSFSRTGPTDNVKNLKRSQLEDYINTHFKGPRIVLSVAGGVDHNSVVNQAKERFSQIPLVYDKSQIPIMSSCRFTGSDIRVRDDSMPLAHVAIAVEGAGYDNPDHLPLMLASNLMGCWDRSHGGGSNSSSYMALASATDNLSHCYRSFNLSYKGTGLWGVYFASERMKLEDFSWHLQEEWRRLCTEVTDNELNRAKHLLMTNILLQSSEGSTAIAEDIGKQILSYGKRLSLSEIEDKIWSINAQKVRDICSQYIWDRCPAVAAIGPVENLPLYEELRSKMFWFRY